MSAAIYYLDQLRKPRFQCSQSEYEEVMRLLSEADSRGELLRKPHALVEKAGRLQVVPATAVGDKEQIIELVRNYPPAN